MNRSKSFFLGLLVAIPSIAQLNTALAISDNLSTFSREVKIDEITPLEIVMTHSPNDNKLVVVVINNFGLLGYTGPDDGQGPWTKQSIAGTGRFSLSHQMPCDHQGNCYFSFVDSTDAGGPDAFLGKWNINSGFTIAARISDINDAYSSDIGIQLNPDGLTDEIKALVYNASNFEHIIYRSGPSPYSFTADALPFTNNATDATFGGSRALFAVDPDGNICVQYEAKGPTPNDLYTLIIQCLIDNFLQAPFKVDTEAPPATTDFTHRTDGTWTNVEDGFLFLNPKRDGGVFVRHVELTPLNISSLKIGTVPPTQTTPNYRGTGFGCAPTEMPTSVVCAWSSIAVGLNLDDLSVEKTEPFPNGFGDSTGPTAATTLRTDNYDFGDTSAWATTGSLVALLYGPAFAAPPTVPPPTIPPVPPEEPKPIPSSSWWSQLGLMLLLSAIAVSLLRPRKGQ